MKIKGEKVYTSHGNKTAYKDITELVIIIDEKSYKLKELIGVFIDLKKHLDEMEREL